jgi:inosose dehydratase
VAEAFLPLHFARAHLFDEDRVAFRATLKLLAETADPVLRPVAVLSESFREAARWRAAGRIALHPELQLPDNLLPTLVANLHRAAEECLDAGLTPAFHHHAGTFVETNDEIRRVFELVDGALVGLCLDTAHALLGGADPVALVQDYGSLIRDVHVKDISLSVVAASSEKERDLTELTEDGAFVPLGTGDAPVVEVVRALADQRYAGWMVIEQDRLLFEGSRIDDVTDDQRQNIAFLKRLLGS